MKKKPFLPVFILILLIVTGCSKTNYSQITVPVKDTKNIILMIGDGMGVAQIYAGMTVSNTPFYLEKFPYSGFSKTYSADNYITDSAAGGTAISSGIKTNNKKIGVTPDNLPVPSILEIAHKNGLSTGVVSTSSVTHATPASFVAHNVHRDNYEEIAEDFLKGTADVFIGGGEDNFRKRKDGRDLTTDLKNAGYDVVYDLNSLNSSTSDKIAGLLAKNHMPKVSEGRVGVLEAMTRKAIDVLSKDKDGFFLMVEGSMIDFGGHANDIDYTVSETIDFDKAVGVALEFAGKNNETLVIVTADHETGGLTLPGGSIVEHKIIPAFSTKDHSAVMVPVFSYGPGAEIFSGINENTSFFNKFIKLLNLN